MSDQIGNEGTERGLTHSNSKRTAKSVSPHVRLNNIHTKSSQIITKGPLLRSPKRKIVYDPEDDIAGPGSYDIPGSFEKGGRYIHHGPSFSFSSKHSEKQFISRAHLFVQRGLYSPGSAAYCPSYKMTTAQTPAHRINSSKLYRNYLAKESLDPGPIYNYYAPGDISNPDKLKKAPRIRIDYMKALPTYKESSPSSCDYTVKAGFDLAGNSGRGFSMGPRKSSILSGVWEKGIKARKQFQYLSSPGPGSYQPPQTSTHNAKANLFSKSAKSKDLVEDHARNVGPGRYNLRYQNMERNFGGVAFFKDPRKVDVRKWGSGYSNIFKQI